ncbi:hypothetical protein Mahau_0287 [Mahella australiensis 50-1 BON]|uniref:Zinc-ribbon domain-containing protein n=2 Tax=Mahella TaxID=252965 RepID=F3ZX55_MAHA5|nr:hypothetical protein Mahau_0287 [Mahella australiensis 50-1 BON]
MLNITMGRMTAMYCTKCGAALPRREKTCQVCGAQQGTQGVTGTGNNESLIGFSGKIDDQTFENYIRKSKRRLIIFGLVSSAVIVVGAIVGNAIGLVDMTSGATIFTVLFLAAMFLFVCLLQAAAKGRGRTWDGTVVDKSANRRTRRRRTGDDSYLTTNYMEYVVKIQEDNGKKHKFVTQNDDRFYNYFQIGDKVRYHGRLKSYEKYDKSHDEIIICNACSTVCDIGDDFCPHCGCPLLK